MCWTGEHFVKPISGFGYHSSDHGLSSSAAELAAHGPTESTAVMSFQIHR